MAMPPEQPAFQCVFRTKLAFQSINVILLSDNRVTCCLLVVLVSLNLKVSPCL